MTQSAARLSLDASPGARLLMPSKTSRLARRPTSVRVEAVLDGTATRDGTLRIGVREEGTDERGAGPPAVAVEFSHGARALDDGGVVGQVESRFMGARFMGVSEGRNVGRLERSTRWDAWYQTTKRRSGSKGREPKVLR